MLEVAQILGDWLDEECEELYVLPLVVNPRCFRSNFIQSAAESYNKCPQHLQDLICSRIPLLDLLSENSAY